MVFQDWQAQSGVGENRLEIRYLKEYVNLMRLKLMWNFCWTAIMHHVNVSKYRNGLPSLQICKYMFYVLNYL